METTTKYYDELIKVIGINKPRLRLYSHFDFIHIASNGLNANVILNFRAYFNLPQKVTANMLNVSVSSIARWTKGNKNLDRNLSVQLMEISYLFLFGIEIFESKKSFLKWLYLPNFAFGGMQPQELISIPEGVSKIKDVLGRIESGVYS